MERIGVSFAEEYFLAVKKELTDAFSSAHIERLAPEVAVLESSEITLQLVAETSRRQPFIFVQHLMRELTRIPIREATSENIVAAALALLKPAEPQPAIALQLWVSGVSALPVRADILWHQIADAIRATGREVGRGQKDEILSVCVTPRGVLLGLNPRADALTDWPGGRVGLAKVPGQISRSEFKLEEAIQIFALPLPTSGRALDLGASPGGWTHILRARGLAVTAVDPATLDPRLGGDANLRHVRTTAQAFLREYAPADKRAYFSVIANDMRMDPDVSAELMVRAARLLEPEGWMILTLKLTPNDPLRVVRYCLRVLSQAYAIVHVRQLFHNRNEVTVIARPRSTPVVPTSTTIERAERSFPR